MNNAFFKFSANHSALVAGKYSTKWKASAMIRRTLDNGSDHSDTEALKLFQETLKDTPPGELRPGDEDRIIGVLAKCWDQLSGATETSMRAYKLHRVERFSRVLQSSPSRWSDMVGPFLARPEQNFRNGR